MAFRIKPHKPLTRDIRRVALERLQKAQTALLLPAEERVRGIHQARKRIKETRALLRLVRKPLGKHYKRENRRLRDINRRLSDMRDAGALVEAWDALTGWAPELFAVQDKQAVRKQLVLRSQDGGHTVEESHRLLSEALAELAEAQERVTAWPLQGNGFSLLRQGLARSFDDGRTALAAAEQSATDERLHDWRKQVKDHWYHTLLFRAAWPEAFKARARLLRELSELLGQDQDLALLQDLLATEPSWFGNDSQRTDILAAAGQRREWLQKHAFRLGRRIYAEGAAPLCKRWSRYWDIARVELR